MFNINMGEIGTKYKELLAMNMKHYQEFANFCKNSMPVEMQEQMSKFDFTPQTFKTSEIFGDDFTVKSHQQFVVWQEQMKKAQEDMKKFNSDFASNAKKFTDEMKVGMDKWQEKMMSHMKVEKEKHTQTK